MKDAHDQQTADLLPLPKKRGRPATGKAMTPAQKQAAYRQRQAEKSVTVTFNRKDIPALKLILANPSATLELQEDTLSRLNKAVFDAALNQK